MNTQKGLGGGIPRGYQAVEIQLKPVEIDERDRETNRDAERICRHVSIHSYMKVDQ